MYGPGDVRFFDRLSWLYDRLMPRARAAPLREGLSLADRRVERLVDLGGGTGRGARAVAEAVPDAERVVLDAAPSMVREARGHGLAGIVGDATRLPFHDDAVDAIVVVDALHHMPNAQLVLDECARVLAPDGVVVIREFDPTTVPGRGLVVAENLLGFGSRFFTPDRLAMRVGDAGFEARVLDRGFGYTVAGRREAATA